MKNKATGNANHEMQKCENIMMKLIIWGKKEKKRKNGVSNEPNTLSVFHIFTDSRRFQNTARRYAIFLALKQDQHLLLLL